MRIAVTGGAGFIGSAVIRRVLFQTDDSIVNIDKLTYAGNLDSLPGAEGHPRYAFEQADICDRHAMVAIFRKHRPEAVIHLAAESHVDRSIDSPADFMHTNVVGTFNLLECATDYWWNLAPVEKEKFRFLHVSTDEVYGDLALLDEPFVESSRYRPSSPYAASKASSDHLARAWNRTFGLPVIVTNCSNNYGPYQFPEKLIPLMILNGTAGKELPVYGDGCQIRDWLYVDDHALALLLALKRGRVAETYNIGGCNEHKNLDVVRMVCALLDELVTEKRATCTTSYSDLITFVSDRPGHDRRYAIDSGKIAEELGWEPNETLQSGLRKTVQWYLENPTWVQNIQRRGYHGGRLGASNRGEIE